MRTSIAAGSKIVAQDTGAVAETTDALDEFFEGLLVLDAHVCKPQSGVP